MPKDEFRSQEELTVAAVGYIPPVWLVFAIWHKWRANYFTRYHLAHAFLLTLVILCILVGTSFLMLSLSAWVGFSFTLVVLTGGIIALSLLLTFGAVFYCALNAYQGRYIVLPLLTRIYYMMFGQRLSHQKGSQLKRQLNQLGQDSPKKTRRKRDGETL